MKPTELQVRIYHCDAYGHVNNARYLEFLEEARWNWLQPAIKSGDLDESKIQFVLVNLNIAYKKALVPGDIIHISVSDLRYTRATVVLKQEIRTNNGATLCSEADITFVILDAKTGRPMPISDSIQAIFNRLMEQDA